ncbi:MAG: transketolase [Bacteroidales bacterium]|nr:transketolase [Bacteroidales bacterium]
MITKVENIPELKSISKQIRRDVLESITRAGSGHTGGSLGLADVMTALYFSVLNHDPKNPDYNDRDRLILSIGHVAPVLYAALARSGYFPVEELKTLRQLDSRLQGHPGRDHGLPGLELSAGSLGQGLSVAVGMALAAKMDKKSHRVFSIHGDGELQEGSIWEAAMSAGHHKLDNLIAIVDRNEVQIDGKTEEVMGLEPLADKWRSFRWEVFGCDGHDFRDLLTTLQQAKDFKGKPSLVLARTRMGKGVRSIENNHLWHGKAPTSGQLVEFVKELERSDEV